MLDINISSQSKVFVVIDTCPTYRGNLRLANRISNHGREKGTTLSN